MGFQNKLGRSTGLGTGLGKGGMTPPSRVYDPLSVDYFTRAGITNTTEKNAVDDLVLSIKANTNIYNATINGAIYLVSPTSYGAALHNLMSSSFTLTEGVAPTFSTTEGFTFDGVTQYLKSGIIPSTHLTDHNHTTIILYKNYGATGFMWSVASNSGTRWFYVRNNRLVSYNPSISVFGANTDTSGSIVASTYANASKELRKNGSSFATNFNNDTVARPTLELYMGANNNSGSGLSNIWSGSIYTLAQTTTSLAAADADDLEAYLKTYNQNVISGGR